MSNWDVRGFTLEANMDSLDNNSRSLMMDTEPCTGDQLADAEKVWVPNLYPIISL